MHYGNSCRCEVFRAMFSTPTTSDDNAPLILSDVKPIVFMAVLEFIYTNSCNLTADIVCVILVTHMLQQCTFCAIQIAYYALEHACFKNFLYCFVESEVHSEEC